MPATKKKNDQSYAGRIMIVDDDDFDRSLMARKVRAALADCDLIEIEKSADALSAFKDSEPDLVLLDIRMPAPDGFELLSILKETSAGRKAAVVMLSGSTHPLDRMRAESLGADGYEVKPNTLSGYDRMIESLADKWLRRN